VLNEHTRFAGLPIAGNDADTTANQVCLWQTGYPVRVSFAGGRVDYDPHRHGVAEAIARGDIDALMWIASFDPSRVPPSTSLPTIVLARPGMHVSPPAAVQIDVATPGVHHAGHFYRGDSVVAVRLRGLLDSPLPSVAAVVGQIAAAL
jgi:formylmethanofuran dehydrogenase subunit B